VRRGFRRLSRVCFKPEASRPIGLRKSILCLDVWTHEYSIDCARILAVGGTAWKRPVCLWSGALLKTDFSQTRWPRAGSRGPRQPFDGGWVDVEESGQPRLVIRRLLAKPGPPVKPLPTIARLHGEGRDGRVLAACSRRRGNELAADDYDSVYPQPTGNRRCSASGRMPRPPTFAFVFNRR